MIRINIAKYTAAKMLGSDGIQVGANGDLLLMNPEVIKKQALGRVLLMAAIPIILLVYQTINIPKLESIRATKQSKKSELEAFNKKAATAVEEINKFQEEEKKIQDRIGAVEKISQERMTEIKILDLFQQIVPERLWFTRLESTGDKVRVQGFAVNDFEVSSFMEKLQQSIYIDKVDLVSSVDEKKDDFNLKHFELSLDLKFKKKD